MKLAQHISTHVRTPATYWCTFSSDSLAVLGIGERVGITPLGGLVACLYAANPEYVKAKYNLPMLREIENLVAEAVEVNIPFMNPITFVKKFRFVDAWNLIPNIGGTVRSRTRPVSMLKQS